MKVGGVAFRSIRLADDGWAVEIVDQTRLPHDFVIRRLESLPDAVFVSKPWMLFNGNGCTAESQLLKAQFLTMAVLPTGRVIAALAECSTVTFSIPIDALWILTAALAPPPP